jgi:hypothetical protein
MSLVAKSEGNTDYKPIEEGVHIARCIGLIDLGQQDSIFYEGTKHHVLIIWDIPAETYEKDDEVFTRQISKEFTMSLHEKANLRKTLDSWRGKRFTEKELEGFNLINILGKGCQIQIVNVEKNGKTYSNIQAIMTLPKGAKIEEAEKTTVFDFDDKEALGKITLLPEWIQNKIMKSTTYLEKLGTGEILQGEPVDDDSEEDFPF